MVKLVGAILLFSVCLSSAVAYKDVVFIHGLLAKPDEFKYFQDLVVKYHPGTRISSLNIYDGYQSVTPLWYQIGDFLEQLKPILTNTSSEGTILISFSQGGMISRGLLAFLEHNVETWISLSGPLAGQYGDTDYLKFFFPTYVKQNIFKFFYTKEGQLTSIGNFWYDPHHYDMYTNYSEYLAILNNETTFANPSASEFRSNFLRLKNLVLIGGPDDGVITPWQSSHFGQYDHNEVVQPLTSQKWFANDAFGLKTLYDAGAIHFHTVNNITHTDWHEEKFIFDKYILPWLK